MRGSSRSLAPAALILAAGEGRRMRSSRVKLLHEVGGLSVVAHVVASARAAGARRIVAVLGVQAAEVRSAIERLDADATGKARPVEFCHQSRQLGTAHAVMAARSLLAGERGTLLILNGDVPLALPSTLRSFAAFHRRRKAALTVLTARLADPSGYGRIVRGSAGDLVAILEEADLGRRKELKAIDEVNAGLYCAEIDGLFQALEATSRSNAQGEYYLPEIVQVLRERGRVVEAMLHEDSAEVLGINTRADLAAVMKTFYRRRASELMASGVTMIDPESTYVDAGVRIGRDTVIHPSVRIEGRTRVGSGCIVRAGTRISESTLGDGVEVLDHCVIVESTLGRGSRVGPFAHLRPGSRLGPDVRIGNFVETKEASLGAGSKANHLSYLGDAEIGRGVNVGAGTITCNYDGWKKHRTVLQDGVFIGSDTQLVAPVIVGRKAFVGAGSTITKDVPAEALAMSRVKQQVVKGWAARKRKEMEATRPGKPRRR